MTVPTASLPSLGQWRLLVLLQIRAAFTAECRASQMLNRTDARASDLGELAEEGWVTGHDHHGEDINLAENWNHSLAHVYLRLRAKGIAWLAGNPHTRLLFEIAAAQGAYRMKPAEVKDQDEVLQQLIGKRYITAVTDTRPPCDDSTPPSKQAPGEELYVRLTERGRSIVSP